MANPRKKVRKEQPAPPRFAAALAWVRMHALALVIALAVLATIRIVTTYSVFNHTCDEPAHVACGMEWIEKGTYHLEPQHPPLARIATALGPYLVGCRLPSEKMPPGATANGAIFNYMGADVLYSQNQYLRNLSLARMGILPFFWICTAVIYLWGRRYFGELEAVIAVFLFTFLPPVLAHSGLATTDIPVTAMISAAFLAGL